MKKIFFILLVQFYFGCGPKPSTSDLKDGGRNAGQLRGHTNITKQLRNYFLLSTDEATEKFFVTNVIVNPVDVQMLVGFLGQFISGEANSENTAESTNPMAALVWHEIASLFVASVESTCEGMLAGNDKSVFVIREQKYKLSSSAKSMFSAFCSAQFADPKQDIPPHLAKVWAAFLGIGFTDEATDWERLVKTDMLDSGFVSAKNSEALKQIAFTVMFSPEFLLEQ